MDTCETASSTSGKSPVEDLSKEEIIIKYKGLLGLAKKAKTAKDEYAEENRRLREILAVSETQKEADKNALLTMKEMVEEFTQNKLNLSSEISELRQTSKIEKDHLVNLRIENESLKRQLERLTEENEDLLNDIDRTEQQLKQVNLLGMEQKEQLDLLELEVNKLKQTESYNKSLQLQISDLFDENKSLKEKHNESTQSLEQLSIKYRNVKEVNLEQKDKFNSLKDRFVVIYRKLKKLKECRRILLETQKEYADAISQWQKEIVVASEQLCSHIAILKKDNSELKLQLETKSETDVYKSSTTKPLAEVIIPKLFVLHQYCSKALNEQKVDRAELLALQIENNRLRTELATTGLQEKQLDGKDEVNALRSLNITELYEIETLREQFQLITQERGDLQSALGKKEREHTDLLLEMRELNEALKGRGDVISRQQEKQQELLVEMKNTTLSLDRIERQLNDKDLLIYEKEVQISSLGKQIDIAGTEIIHLQSVCQENEQKVESLSDELKKMEIQLTSDASSCLVLGRSDDTQSEILSTSTVVSKAEELSRLREVDDSFEEKYNKLRGLAIKLKRKVQEQTQYIIELENKNQDISEQLANTKIDRQCLQEEFDQSTKQIDLLKADILKLKASHTKSNFLNLEIEAYEKSLNETSAKLSAKNSELETLRESMQSRENTIEQLHKEISLLESAKEAECAHSVELKQQIDHLQLQVKELVQSKRDLYTANKEFEQENNYFQNELADLQLQLVNNANARDADKLVFQADKETILRQFAQLEEELATTKATLNSTQRSLEDLRVEHMEYKVKAQAVLRKNQKKEFSKEPELEEELAALRTERKELSLKLSTFVEKINFNEKTIENIREDNESLHHRSKELSDLVMELRQQNDELALENRQQVQFYQDSLKKHRVQIENLDACHKQQLKDLDEQHLCKIEELKSLHLNTAQGFRVPPTIGGPKTVTAPYSSYSALSNSAAALNSDQNKIEFLLMEREAAEGSEEADVLAPSTLNRTWSTSSRQNLDFMPLDELLSTSMNVMNDTVIINSEMSVMDELRSVSPRLELQATKERLQIQESRVRHLTALLAENEQDLAKLTQLNDMLKEEVRRQERSVEREKHMHNSEYLKNVILKFLTLNNGDERTRLIPVLNTILKFSRNETEMLTNVAKGQKITSESNNRNWGSFLASWSSSSSHNNNN